MRHQRQVFAALDVAGELLRLGFVLTEFARDLARAFGEAVRTGADRAKETIRALGAAANGKVGDCLKRL